LFRHYYANTQALIYVIDSNDRDRINEAVDEMKRFVLYEDELKNCVIVVLANKQDLSNAMTVNEIRKNLNQIESNRDIEVFGTVATTGNGLDEAFEYLFNKLQSID
jgi:ADP-ribosylation factor protein 1